jgi:hypothetical protein
MDLMMFFPKKVVITFDFQHPVENYRFSVDGLPKCEGGIRFFEPGNHFSDNLYVAKCVQEEVDDHLPMFKKYLETYRTMLLDAKPTGKDVSEYKDFDTYMTNLYPISYFHMHK